MGQRITLDIDPNNQREFDALNIYDHQLRAQIKKLVAQSYHVNKVLESNSQNHLRSKYCKSQPAPRYISQIIHENGDPKGIASLEGEYLNTLLQYYQEMEAKYVLNIFKDKRRRVTSKQTDTNRINFLYLYGTGNDIVLLKYYMLQQLVLVEEQHEGLVLLCYSIEAFDPSTIPLCFSTVLKIFLAQQQREFSKVVESTKQGGSISQDLAIKDNTSLQALVKDAITNGKIVTLTNLQ